MKFRRILALVLAVLTALALTACGAPQAADPLADVPEELRQYVIPWKLDVSQKAADAKEIHFYFMSGEHMLIDPYNEKGQTEKWGDSCLVVFPNGETMLIDAAFSVYTPVLMENLKRLGITELDYAVISHPHTDHYQGFTEPNGVLTTIPIKKVYYAQKYYELLAEFEGAGVEMHQVLKGDTFEIGGVKLTVLSPDQYLLDNPATKKSETNTNNASMVLRMDYGEFSALFCGDLYKAQERLLAKEYEGTGLLDVDLLKLPHHGDTTSSSTEWANATSPKLGVATGALTLDTSLYFGYAKHAHTVLHDFQDGYAHVWSNGDTLEWETSRERGTEVYDAMDAFNADKKTPGAAG